MIEQQLIQFCEQVRSEYFGSDGRKIESRYKNYRGLRATVQWNHERIRLNISAHYQQAPSEARKILILILLAKANRKRIPLKIREPLNRFHRSWQNENEPKRRAPAGYQTRGKYYDLHKIFNEVNEKYFADSVEIQYLGWSKRQSRRRLGFYDKRRDLLVVSRIFDSRKVPVEVVEYIVYHEMLHKVIPPIARSGRRIVHTTEFRSRERHFDQFDRVQQWLKKYPGKL